jgi:ATP-binding cassette subfamily B protein
MRFYEPTAGEILVDGVPIDEVDLRSYRSQIGYVPQESFLFSDTIHNNILFGNSGADLNQVQQAAKGASVINDILSFEKGFDTIVGERGITLSGGQKQRVSIARAMLMNPAFFILDDSLSAVDYYTEQQILKSLFEKARGKSLLFVTNRIFSLADFDRILVLDNGIIKESGSHTELIALNGFYRSIYEQRLAASG